MDFKLSVSKTKTFLDCKKKYDFQYNLKIPSKSFDYHTLGKLIHSVLEHFHLHYMNGGNDKPNAVMKVAYKIAITEISKADFKTYFSKYFDSESLKIITEKLSNKDYDIPQETYSTNKLVVKLASDYFDFNNWKKENKITEPDGLAYLIFKYSTIIKQDIKTECYSLAKDYLQQYCEIGKKQNSIGCEKPFSIEIPTDFDVSIKLSGAIDRVQIDEDGVYHICDYKTTKNITYLEKDFFQLLAYAYIIYTENPHIKKMRGSYICLKHKGIYLTQDFSLDQIMTIPGYFIKNTKKIVEEKEFAPRPTKLCDYCSYCDICEFAYKEIEPYW